MNFEPEEFDIFDDIFVNAIHNINEPPKESSSGNEAKMKAKLSSITKTSRMVANRLSAQASRRRKLLYVKELERKCEELNIEKERLEAENCYISIANALLMDSNTRDLL